MQITVFGASGKVGRLVVAEALKRGHSVVAFVHKKNGLSNDKNLKIVQGDIYNAASAAKAIKGSDAVISALGSWGTPDKDIVKAGIKNIIPAMQTNKIKRIVSLTGHGANAPGDKFDPLHIISRWILVILAPKILHDGEDHIEQLAKTNLDWTIIRSSMMVNSGKPKKFKVTTKRPLPLALVNRQSVATALVDLAENRSYLKQAPFIVRSFR
jgi:putative NADH-flavin reductase